MKREKTNGKKDLKIKKYKIENSHKKLPLQVTSTQNPTFFKRGNLMNFKKTKKD